MYTEEELFNKFKVSLEELRLLENDKNINVEDVLFAQIILYYSLCSDISKNIYEDEIYNTPGAFRQYWKAAKGLKFKLYIIFLYLHLTGVYYSLENSINSWVQFYKNFIGYKKFYCPCCGNHIKFWDNFKFANNDYNPNIYINSYKKTVCPICNSLPRHRIFAKWLSDNVNLFRNKKILGFGFGSQEKVIFDKLKIKFNTADLTDGYDFKYDLQNINCQSESWDIIICNHVLEHVKDYKKALRELRRVLKTGGFAIISVPTRHKYSDTFEEFYAGSEIKRKFYYGQNSHLRIFGDNFTSYLEDAGFTVQKIKGEYMPKNIRPVVGPADYDDNCLYICKK